MPGVRTKKTAPIVRLVSSGPYTDYSIYDQAASAYDQSSVSYNGGDSVTSEVYFQSKVSIINSKSHAH